MDAKRPGRVRDCITIIITIFITITTIITVVIIIIIIIIIISLLLEPSVSQEFEKYENVESGLKTVKGRCPIKEWTATRN